MFGKNLKSILFYKVRTESFYVCFGVTNIKHMVVWKKKKTGNETKVVDNQNRISIEVF